MRCHSCGALLPDGTTTCPACGAMPQANGSKSPYELDDEAVPFIDYPGRKPGHTTPPAPLSSGASQSPTFSTTVQAGTTLAPQHFDAPQAPRVRHTQPHRGISAGVAALLVVLAFLLVGGSGFGYYLAKVQPTELNAQATTVVQNILTAQVQASAQAKSQAFAAFTAKSPQDIYQQIISRKPDLSDPMSEPDANIWVNFNSPVISCFFNQGAYHVLDTSGPSFGLCPAINSNFSNFAYQVQARILRGDSIGLLFRMDIKHDIYYQFIIHRDGGYTLYVRQPNFSEPVVARGSSNSILAIMSQSPFPSFTATVIAFSSYIYLYINGQFLTSTKDNTVGSGSIGVCPSSDSSPTETVFSNVKVWIL